MPSNTSRDEELAPAILFSLAESLRQSGQQGKAQLAFASVTRDFPDSPWSDEALYAQMKLDFDNDLDSQNVVRAKEFEERYAQSSLLPNVRQLLGRTLLRQEAYETAIEVFRGLAANVRADVDVENDIDAQTNRYYLGLAHLGAHEYEEADRLLRNLKLDEAQHDLADGVYRARISLLLSTDKYSDAIDVIRIYQNSFPDRSKNPQLQNNLFMR